MNIHQQKATHEFMTMATASLDPWEQQTKLMSISGQRIAFKPTMHPGVLTYLALLLEEVSETIGAVVGTPLPPVAENSQEDPFPALLRALRPMLYQAAEHMGHSSVFLRNAVAGLSEQEKREAGFPLDHASAVELLDGCTDVHVVTAGLSISAGLPGAAAYDEVVGSNLSKADPQTGRIIIDPSGKWIKGPNYRLPNLGALLTRYEETFVVATQPWPEASPLMDWAPGVAYETGDVVIKDGAPTEIGMTGTSFGPGVGGCCPGGPHGNTEGS